MTPSVGEIRAFAGNYAPAGWHLCDGTILPIANNETLFALLGTKYGGDGSSTFALPSLCGRQAIGQGQGPGRTNRVLGQNGGSETVTLTESQIGAHTHAVQAATVASNVPAPEGNYLAAPVDVTTPATQTVAYLPSTFSSKTMVPLDNSMVSYEGGNQPHENRMPFMPISYIICMAGIFPQSA